MIDRYDMLLTVGIILIGVAVAVEYGIVGSLMYAGAALVALGILGARDQGKG